MVSSLIYGEKLMGPNVVIKSKELHEKPFEDGNGVKIYLGSRKRIVGFYISFC
jgi:hypothetical protein